MTVEMEVLPRFAGVRFGDSFFDLFVGQVRRDNGVVIEADLHGVSITNLPSPSPPPTLTPPTTLIAGTVTHDATPPVGHRDLHH